ncbi:hypothetical protein [Aquimarina sp. 2201CG5-10]|uniref:hypothetical protein n=1 Tax=Aquimarina callyspongiae TaxID=3098150 RepID=UPI002AB361C9|nr:hypothetical protein [Aquimarina sp. 2201CG5-10]MDY8136190.1 hypothetical protein [Aquimarina sp. 2201CG5-10]
MKKTITITIVLMVIFSCGRDKEKEKEPGLFDLIEGVSDLKKVAKEAEKIEEENDKLLKATPISKDELKALLPETILGRSRKKFSIGNQFMPDMNMAEAEYEDEEGAIISFSIIDGAGETGSAMITLARLGFSRDFEEQTDWGFRKSTTIQGYKAVEEIERNQYDDSENSKIELLIANRFMVSLEGERVSINQLKKAVDEINLKTLERKAN